MNAVERNARATAGFEQRLQQAVALLRQAAADHPGRIVQTTSLGVEGMVITDLIARHGLAIPVATLDTGLLHPETQALLPAIRERWGIEVEVFRPQQQAVVQFVRHHGELAMRDSVALRQQCCATRKLEPMERLLSGRDAFITGMRHEQSPEREQVAAIETDDADRTQYNPLVDWSWADVWHYVQLHDVPYNPLHDAFMPSIGCAPCTRAVAVGEPFRAGRWWWESADEAKECGLHTRHATPLAA